MNRQSARPVPVEVPDGFTRHEEKELLRRQNAEVTRGIVAATRVQAAALTASVGIQCVGMLSREAQFQADGDPAVMNRLNYIVDQFACIAGNEVARFGL
ncbi:hypothetical protein FZ046_00940 [Mycolicibacterium grossiae]|nr:hypothetical protein FZ046_00940 [Mycolicibacterium grossiae]